MNGTPGYHQGICRDVQSFPRNIANYSREVGRKLPDTMAAFLFGFFQSLAKTNAPLDARALVNSVYMPQDNSIDPQGRYLLVPGEE